MLPTPWKNHLFTLIVCVSQYQQTCLTSPSSIRQSFSLKLLWLHAWHFLLVPNYVLLPPQLFAFGSMWGRAAGMRQYNQEVQLIQSILLAWSLVFTVNTIFLCSLCVYSPFWQILSSISSLAVGAKDQRGERRRHDRHRQRRRGGISRGGRDGGARGIPAHGQKTAGGCEGKGKQDRGQTG